ncbi:phage tail tube protein [Methylotenera sp.]|uniref:phage tail tube protein n=1 Tax=Methylotenera sp. TaxID=2051956 RepID=UPI00248962BC|nr:phage tail tube protein [Methylotenera sp.]MDI1362512.1 phage tail tube protein [Methylotenera sp.]
MPLASSSSVGFKFKKEAVFGTVVNGTACNALRIAGESLDYAIKTDTSKEIRADRQISDLIITGAEASGGFTFELSYGEFDPFLEAVLEGTYAVFGTNGVSAVIPTSATFAANTLTAGAATTGVNLFTNLVLGQWVLIQGSTNPLQNIWAQVSTTIPPTNTVLTFQGSPFTGATGTGGAAVTVSGSRVSNGTTQRSYTLEKNFSDVAQTLTYTGMTADKLSLKIASGSILGGSIDFKGKSATSQVGSLLGTTTASTAFNVMNAVNDVSSVLENGSALVGTYIKSLSLDVMNNLRGQDGVGVLGNASVASGNVQVSGSVEFYFADNTLYNKFLNNTASSLSIRVDDGSNNGYVITIPKIKYSGGKITAGGINQDVMVSMSYTGLFDPTTGKTIIIDRAGVAVLPTTPVN